MSRSLTAFVVSAFLVSVSGCDCNSTKLTPKETCEGVPNLIEGKNDPCDNDAACGNHAVCKTTKAKPNTQCCVFTDRTCNTEADCCPGQTCRADSKQCFDRFTGCTADADCGPNGDLFCEEYTDVYGTSKRCKLHSCGAGDVCPAGQSCFQGSCMASLPCNGSCDPGKGCVADINRCQDYALANMDPERPTAACPMTCTAGFIATFKEPRNIWDSCDLPKVACLCAELPPLQSNDLGRFSAIASNPGAELFVSEYDGQYGDLVVVRYGLDGVVKSTEYVDGVPSATPTYGPSGVRGGVAEPGDDVGRYTDIAVSGGRAFVSYYDVTNGDLKFALRGTDGTWSKHTVDSAGNVGMYTSIAIGADGRPAISYFQYGADATFDVSQCPGTPPTGALKNVTALKLARANTSSPASASDWTVKVLACADRAPTLTADGGEIEPALQQVSPGVGLFTSIAFKGSDAVIAYQRRNKTSATPADGDLYALTVDSAGTASAPVLIDASGDTGFFPDVKIANDGTIGIGYHDFTSKAFKFYYQPSLTAGTTSEIIDTGINPNLPGDQGWVGTDSAIVYGGPGITYALYQDATHGDLKLARRENGAWQGRTSPRVDGAVGFFADAVRDGTKLFITHARIHTRLVASAPTLDNSLLLETVTAE